MRLTELSGLPTAATYHRVAGEFPFSDSQFRRIGALMRRLAGIKLPPSKKSMVYSRLARRLRELELHGFDEYLALIDGPRAPTELGHLVNALTTNLTAFYREPHHFQALGDIVRALAASSLAGTRLRLWSAGSSSGEEPYSMAMAALEALPPARQGNLKILATDIDSEMLAIALAGRYSERAVRTIPAAQRSRWLERVNGPGGVPGFVFTPALRSVIAFHRLNLLSRWPFEGKVHVIFCRNVMIYFDRQTQEELVQRFAGVLHEGGYLVLGHSEAILPQACPFRLVGRTLYQKVTCGKALSAHRDALTAGEKWAAARAQSENQVV